MQTTTMTPPGRNLKARRFSRRQIRVWGIFLTGNALSLLLMVLLFY